MHYQVIFSVLMAIVFTGCSGGGMISGNFILASESPLPVWVKMPQNMSRTQIVATIDSYERVFTETGSVIIKVATTDGKVLQRAKGKWKWHPKSFKPGSKSPEYPNWVVITINNTREIYEQKQPGDVLWIVDESKIK